MPTAFADVGTNMAKLLVAGWKDGDLDILAEGERYIRLGEDMGRSGKISPGAIERLRLALEEFKEQTREHGARQLFAAGTSAIREAANQQEVVDICGRRMGVPLEVMSEQEEARWTFGGACSAAASLAPPVAVLDIGGGSSEIAVGDPSIITIGRWWSLPVGSVRLTEDHLGLSPVAERSRQRAEEYVDQQLLGVQPAEPLATLLASTATANILGRLNGTPDALSRADVDAWADHLLSMPPDEVRELDPPLLKGRADVLPAGALILGRTMRHLGVDRCLISSRRLVHGLALRHFLERQRWES